MTSCSPESRSQDRSGLNQQKFMLCGEVSGLCSWGNLADISLTQEFLTNLQKSAWSQHGSMVAVNRHVNADAEDSSQMQSSRPPPTPMSEQTSALTGWDNHLNLSLVAKQKVVCKHAADILKEETVE
ncbi:hypothetical protein C0Q70_03116 [Pomacea canaliculata]|uniref:Uncharacterized protein n=1 Tax=Pomacea canaliculata TaxID=400727 RepID=A0A2T7PRT9_POMCA|nr:hypothetical protein C0Q70_03116 [Pomacea canaliculata]